MAMIVSVLPLLYPDSEGHTSRHLLANTAPWEHQSSPQHRPALGSQGLQAQPYPLGEFWK